MEKLIGQIKKIDISTFNRRPFWIALIGGFAMAFFQTTGVGTSFFSPVSQNQVVEAADDITLKLSKKKNTVQLHSSSQEQWDIDAKAYIVVDMDEQKILAEKNAHVPTSIASLTKVLSAVVALDLAYPSDEFTVSEHAASIEPTKIGVIPGEKMKMFELLQAMLLTSANDATEVMKEGINGLYKQDIFVDAMNEKAKIIGMADSHFQNPQGFDEKGQYSTPYDLALLSLYAIQNYPEIKDIAYKDHVFLPANASHKQFDLYNWNGLLGVYPNTFGLKTGLTELAGNTTIVMSERDGKRILVVLLGAQSLLERDLGAAQLLDKGFEESQLNPIAVDEKMLQERYGRWEFWN